MASPDVKLVFHGSIALITPLTEPATIRVRDNLEHEEALFLVRRPRCRASLAGAFVADMADDGLVIQAE